jgi:hypothetical protein
MPLGATQSRARVDANAIARANRRGGGARASRRATHTCACAASKTSAPRHRPQTEDMKGLALVALSAFRRR